MFTKKEVSAIIISIILLGFIFAFNDGQLNFQFSFWILNFLRIILLVGVSVLLRELFIKLMARRFNSESTYDFWFIERFWFKPSNKFKPRMPFGIIFAVLGVLVSGGKFFFTAIGIHNIKQKVSARTGSKRLFLTDMEESLIVWSGMLINILLIYLGFLFGITQLAGINFFIGLYNLIPFSDLDGAKIFFGSQLIWIFTLGFLLFSYLLLPVNFILALILSLIFGFAFVVIYYFKFG